MGYEVRFDEENASIGWKMMLSSSDFEHEGKIPDRFTCKGKNISPNFRIDNAPLKTQEFSLIVTDPDSPSGNFVHWVLYGIDSGLTVIPENSVPNGALQGINDFGEAAYGGPCPHEGEHRYVFRLYALNRQLDVSPGLSATAVRDAMQGCILAEAELIGLFGG